MQGSLCSLDPPSSGHHLSSPEPIIYNVRISPSLHLLYKKQRRSITLSANVIVQASPFEFFSIGKASLLSVFGRSEASPLFHHTDHLHRSSFTTVSPFWPKVELHFCQFSTSLKLHRCFTISIGHLHSSSFKLHLSKSIFINNYLY